jgi:archaellum biogenesis ATPase FlaH
MSYEDDREIADALSYYVDLVNAGKQVIPQEYIMRFRESVRPEIEILCKTVIVLRDLDIGEQARTTRRLGHVRGPLDK